MEEGIDLGIEALGVWMCPSHLRTMLPFRDSTRALSWLLRGRNLVNSSMWSLSTNPATRRLMYFESLSVWTARMARGKEVMRPRGPGRGIAE